MARCASLTLVAPIVGWRRGRESGSAEMRSEAEHTPGVGADQLVMTSARKLVERVNAHTHVITDDMLRPSGVNDRSHLGRFADDDLLSAAALRLPTCWGRHGFLGMTP